MGEGLGPGSLSAADLLRQDVADLAKQVELAFCRQEELLRASLESVTRAFPCTADPAEASTETTELFRPGVADAPGEPAPPLGDDAQRKISKASSMKSAMRKDHWESEGSKEVFRENHLNEAKRKSTLAVEMAASSDTRERTCMERFRSFLKKITLRKEFEFCIVLLIVSNVTLVGLEVELGSQMPLSELPQFLETMNYVFTGCFTLEIALKMLAVGPVEFYTCQEASWNLFDTLVVLFSLIEVLLEALVVSVQHMRSFRVLRLARMTRGVKAVRVLRYISSLRTLMSSIANTVKSLVWTVVLLMLIFYCFGIALTQAAVDHCRLQAMEAAGGEDVAPHCNDPALERMWSSLPRSVLSLFMALTNGASWYELAAPLEEIHWSYLAVFSVYLTFSFFAVLNVITGVFCHTAIETANSDKEFATMVHLANKRKYTDAIRRIFKEIDADTSDELTLDEFEAKLKDERLSAYLESIDIDTSDAWTLFSLLDSDLSGVVDVEEFVGGCLQLRGPAKAIHMSKMSFENRMQRNMIRGLEEAMVAMADQMDEVVATLQRPRAKPFVRVPAVLSVTTSKATESTGSKGSSCTASVVEPRVEQLEATPAEAEESCRV
eukprot:TRINITY_DN4287_c0_g2_i1.p1 TRINITY_DN4287_c0_g2~~TRINITY_DN4287_c0_g2_i1.p1  ORF type:complete len:623 (-),score=124.05 TRINITY_DN4287_c0_g2_i1:10-1833(-)